jgi:hypothetical protein
MKKLTVGVVLDPEVADLAGLMLCRDKAVSKIEANPNPALVPRHLSFSKTWGGIGYNPMITKILRSALRRVGDRRSFR